MWNYEKRLQYPVKISQCNPRLAQVIITQFGGPDGELSASQRYLAQRYTMPNTVCKGVLTDIGREASEMFNSSAQDFALTAKSVRIHFSGEESGTLPKANFKCAGFCYSSAAWLNCSKCSAMVHSIFRVTVQTGLYIYCIDRIKEQMHVTGKVSELLLFRSYRFFSGSPCGQSMFPAAV